MPKIDLTFQADPDYSTICLPLAEFGHIFHHAAWALP